MVRSKSEYMIGRPAVLMWARVRPQVRPRVRPRKSAMLLLVSTVMMVLMPLAAQAWTVTSTVNRQSMSENDELMLTVTIKDAEGQVDVSPITDFAVLNTMRSSSTRIVNGVRSVLTEYHYQLRPERTGVLSIPPLKVVVNNKVYRTNLQRIKVGAASSGAGAGTAAASGAGSSDGSSGGNKDLFVRAVTSRQTLWEGEQFVYQYALYSRVQLMGGQGKPPAFEGFTAHELKAQEGRDTYDGMTYGVTAWPFLLTPVGTGKLTVEPAEVDVQVAVRRRGGGGAGSLFDQFFGGSMFAGSPFGTSIETRKLRSEPVEIMVKPLPEYHGPGEFSGLVGQFSVRAYVDKDHLKTGDSATLTVEVAGKGNLYDVAGPEILPPDGLKIYEDAPEENIRSGQDGTTGSKKFRWAVVPLKSGEYSLGPFPLVYFDTMQEKYISLTGGPVRLSVTGAPVGAGERPQPAIPSGTKSPDGSDSVSGKASSDATSQASAGGEGADISDLLPLMDGPSAVVDAAPASPWLFAVLLLLPPLGYAVFCITVRAREKAGKGKRAMVSRAEQALKEAGRNKRDVPACLGALSKALVYAVRARANLPGESLTRAEARQLLASDESLRGEVDSLLEAVESARWGGSGVDSSELEKLRLRTRAAVRRLVR